MHAAPPGGSSGGPTPPSTPAHTGRALNASRRAKTSSQQRPSKEPPKKDATERILEAMNVLQSVLPGQINVKLCVQTVQECVAELRKKGMSSTNQQQPTLSTTVCKQIAEIHQAVTSTPPSGTRSWAQVAGNVPPKPKAQ